MTITLKRTVNLSEPILPEVLQAPLYEGEKNAHTFMITAEKDKLPHALSGSVVAYFDRADGNTVRVEGETKDGVAILTLSPECYQTGVFYIAVMLISDGAQTVIYAASGRVKNTQEGEIINGGDAIPTYDEIMAHLNKYLNANISAKVEQKEDGALITMTDADGTTQAFVKNGKNGSGTGGGEPGEMPAPYYITIEKVPDTNGYKTSDDFDYAQMVNAYKQGRPIYITSNPFDTQTEMYAELVKLYDSRAIFAAIDPNGLSIVTVYSDTSALINGGNVTYKGQRIVGAVNNIQPSPSSFLGGITMTAADIPGAVRSVNGENPDENGNVKIGQGTYTLPTMSESTKGGAKVGAGLKMIGDALTVDGASAENAGKLLFVNENGTFSPLTLGTGLKIVNGVLTIAESMAKAIAGMAMAGQVKVGEV